MLAAAIDDCPGTVSTRLCRDVLRALQDPAANVMDAAQVRSVEQYDSVTQELRWTLSLLCEWSLKGSSTVPVRATRPGARRPWLSTCRPSTTRPSRVPRCCRAGPGARPRCRLPLRRTQTVQVVHRHGRVVAGVARRPSWTGRPCRCPHPAQPQSGVASLMATHSLRDLQALPGAHDGQGHGVHRPARSWCCPGCRDVS